MPAEDVYCDCRWPSPPEIRDRVQQDHRARQVHGPYPGRCIAPCEHCGQYVRTRTPMWSRGQWWADLDDCPRCGGLPDPRPPRTVLEDA